ENPAHGRDDARLRVDGSLPAPHRFIRFPEELRRRRLEVSLRQVAGCGAVVLPQLCHGARDHAESRGENGRAVDRLLLRAREDRPDGSYSRCERLHPLSAALRQRPPRDRHRRVDDHVRMRDEEDVALLALPARATHTPAPMHPAYTDTSKWPTLLDAALARRQLVSLAARCRGPPGVFAKRRGGDAAGEPTGQRTGPPPGPTSSALLVSAGEVEGHQARGEAC